MKSRLSLHRLEARDVPSGNRLFAVAGDGGPSRVAVYEAMGPSNGNYEGSGRQLAVLTPYPGFEGGVRVAIGDVTGDGVEDVVTSPGLGGGPHIRIYDGAKLLAGEVSIANEFFAYDPSFRGGVNVAIGQFNPLSTRLEIVTGAAGKGGAHVRVWGQDTFSNDPTFRHFNEFFAYDGGFTGGVRVAAANTDGDNRDEVVTAAGPGGGPHVRVFSIAYPDPAALFLYSHRVIDEFFAYSPSMTSGVEIAAGELDGNTATAEIVTVPSAGAAAHVKLFSTNSNDKLVQRGEIYDSHTVGSYIGVANLSNRSDRQSIYVGDGPGLVYTADFNGADPRLSSYIFILDKFEQQRLLLPSEGEDLGPGLIVSV